MRKISPKDMARSYGGYGSGNHFVMQGLAGALITSCGNNIFPGTRSNATEEPRLEGVFPVSETRGHSDFILKNRNQHCGKVC